MFVKNVSGINDSGQNLLMVILEPYLFAEINSNYLDYFFDNVTVLKREDDAGLNILDYAMIFLKEK